MLSSAKLAAYLIGGKLKCREHTVEKRGLANARISRERAKLALDKAAHLAASLASCIIGGKKDKSRRSVYLGNFLAAALVGLGYDDRGLDLLVFAYRYEFIKQS